MRKASPAYSSDSDSFTKYLAKGVGARSTYCAYTTSSSHTASQSSVSQSGPPGLRRGVVAVWWLVPWT